MGTYSSRNLLVGTYYHSYIHSYEFILQYPPPTSLDQTHTDTHTPPHTYNIEYTCGNDAVVITTT